MRIQYSMMITLLALCYLLKNTLRVQPCPYNLRTKVTVTRDQSIVEPVHEYITRQLQAAPSDCPLLQGTQLKPTKDSICFTYNQLKNDMPSILSNPNLLQKSTILGAATRVIFHDSGEFDQNSDDNLGPDGCLSDGSDSLGLIEFNSPIFTVIETLWLKWCDRMSRADFWVLFANLMLEDADPTRTMKFPFHWGRTDNMQCNHGAGRLPLAQFGIEEVVRVFVDQLGMTLEDGVTLIGAHTVGHVQIANSGFGFEGDRSSGLLNAWDDTPGLFDNHYFQNLMDVNWRNELATVPGQNQWSTPGRQSIMLNIDTTLAYPANTANGLGRTGRICGPRAVNGSYGCTPADMDMPVTCDLVCQYANDNGLFLREFVTAWTKLTNVGYGIPENVDGATSTGRLGTLTAIDLSKC